MLLREFQHVIVGDIEKSGVLKRAAMVIVDKVLRENDCMANGGRADLLEQTLDVEEVEISFQGAGTQADSAHHESGQRTMPARHAQPAAGATGAIADDVDVGVNCLVCCV